MACHTPAVQLTPPHHSLSMLQAATTQQVADWHPASGAQHHDKAGIPVSRACLPSCLPSLASVTVVGDLVSIWFLVCCPAAAQQLKTWWLVDRAMPHSSEISSLSMWYHIGPFTCHHPSSLCLAHASAAAVCPCAPPSQGPQLQQLLRHAAQGVEHTQEAEGPVSPRLLLLPWCGAATLPCQAHQRQGSA